MATPTKHFAMACWEIKYINSDLNITASLYWYSLQEVCISVQANASFFLPIV